MLTKRYWNGNSVCFFLASICLFAAPFVYAQQLRQRIYTEKGESSNALVAHPLSWWPNDPLRLDSSGDLMLGFKAADGQPITAKDYSVEQKITTVGVLSGHKILQLLTTIHPGTRVIAAGFASADVSAGEWKDLLVASGNGDTLVEIYALHYDQGGLIKPTPAEIFGSGPDAILGSYDPDTGNGGGCIDGYWWFDKQGPHEVDFSPLLEAISHAIPPDAKFMPLCWALHPKTLELNSWVERKDAECHACGGLGQVYATYEIEKGAAKPVSVKFEPEQ